MVDIYKKDFHRNNMEICFLMLLFVIFIWPVSVLEMLIYQGIHIPFVSITHNKFVYIPGLIMF